MDFPAEAEAASDPADLTLIEALFPGSHLILPPIDLVEAVFTAPTMSKITEHTA